MKRRQFLGNMMALVPASALSGETRPFQRLNSNSCLDVVVAGGGLCGCWAALKAAQAGARTAIVESRTYLGHEITAGLRPWIHRDGFDQTSAMLREILGDVHPPADGFNEQSVHIGSIKKNLLKTIRKQGIEILFMSQPAGVLALDDRAAGLVVGTKSGLMMIPAKSIIDATENAAVAGLAGCEKIQRVPSISVRRTLEFHALSIPAPATIDVPEGMGITRNQIQFHPGSQGNGHGYVEFSFPVSPQSTRYEEVMEWEVEARKKSIQLCAYLIKNEPCFQKAVLLQASAELTLPPYWELGGVDSSTRELAAVKNLFAPPDELRDYRSISYRLLSSWEEASSAIGARAAERVQHAQSPRMDGCVLHLGKEKIPLASCEVKARRDLRVDFPFYSLRLSEWKQLPSMDDCEVLVAGGGTSGASAAISASSHDVSTTLLEPFSGLGGTGTLGGINRYYHGYQSGFTAELDEKVKEMTERISSKRPASGWNVEAKMMTYFDEINKNKGRIFFRSKAVQTILNGNKAAGVVVSTPDGLRSIQTRVTIDATGDGDLAVWSGAKSVKGGESDGNLQTCNLCNWSITPNLQGVNLDLAVVDINDPFDATRGIVTGHHFNGDYDFSPFLSMRESRHVEGDYKLRLPDVFMEKRFVDTIAIGKTDYDQHGIQNSLFARMGFLPYHRDEKIVRLPYRACIPKGVEGLYVVGKAFSAQSDAFCFMRMQADLQNMGYAIGLAASYAAKSRKSIRSLELKTIQEELLQRGVIRKEDISGKDSRNYQEIVQIIHQGDEACLLPVLCSPRKKILPILAEAYEEASPDGRLLAAKALAWFGSDKGIPDLIRVWDELKDQPQKSELDSSQRPRGGYLGEPNLYWTVNQIIILLGLVKADAAVDALCEMTSKTSAGGPPQSNPRLHWRRIPNYDRILSLCFALGRLKDAKAIAPLEELLQKPYIGGHEMVEKINFEQSYASAYLELLIAGALARCGGQKGVEIVSKYTKDFRSVLSNHARRILRKPL